MYDVCSRSSFENLQTWLDECENYCTDKTDSIVKLLVANKIDLVSFLSLTNVQANRDVTTKEGQTFAKQQVVMSCMY